MNQPELADATGTTKQAIAQIEGGKTKNPRLGLFFAIADHFDVDPKSLALGPTTRKAASQPAGLDPEMLHDAIEGVRAQRLQVTGPTVAKAYDALVKMRSGNKATVTKLATTPKPKTPGVTGNGIDGVRGSGTVENPRRPHGRGKK